MAEAAEKSISQVIADAIVKGFVFIGGNREKAARRAKNFSNVPLWVAWQTSQSVTIGASSNAVTGVHLPAIAIDVIILLHKMAYCCWGVGAINECEIDPENDFAMILGVWSGSIKENELEGFIGAGFALGAIALPLATPYGPQFVGKLAGKGIEEVFTELGLKGLAKAGPKGLMKTGSKGLIALGSIAGPLAEQIVEKTAVKLAAKSSLLSIAAKSASNAVSGFAPFIGPIVSGSINAYFMISLARSANIYYTKKKNVVQKIHAQMKK